MTTALETAANAHIVVQTHIREVFDISGFLTILNVVETRAEALASL